MLHTHLRAGNELKGNAKSLGDDIKGGAKSAAHSVEDGFHSVGNKLKFKGKARWWKFW